MLATTEPGMLASDASKAVEIMFLLLGVEAEEDGVVENDIRDQFQKIPMGYPHLSQIK
jgi:hypothetical protein